MHLQDEEKLQDTKNAVTAIKKQKCNLRNGLNCVSVWPVNTVFLMLDSTEFKKYHDNGDAVEKRVSEVLEVFQKSWVTFRARTQVRLDR